MRWISSRCPSTVRIPSKCRHYSRRSEVRFIGVGDKICAADGVSGLQALNSLIRMRTGCNALTVFGCVQLSDDGIWLWKKSNVSAKFEISSKSGMRL